MRARNLKPKFFKNPLLAPADPLYSIVFEGLWCLADRNGRLEDIPFGIHLEVNPGRAFDGTQQALEWLTAQAFIERYEVAGKRYIQVLQFSKHQVPHHREPALWPGKPELAQVEPRASGSSCSTQSPVQAQASPGPAQGQPTTGPQCALNLPPLNPESGILNPESCSLNPVSVQGTGKPGQAQAARRKRRDPRSTTRMPDAYKPGPDLRAWAAEHTPGVDVDYELGKIRDHTFRTARSDWDAVLRNWLRTAHESRTNRHTPQVTAKTRALTADELDRREIDKAIDVGLSDDEIFTHLQVIPLERIRERRAERLRGANGQHGS